MMMMMMCDLKSFWTKPTAWLKSSPAACPAKVAHQVHVLIMVVMMVIDMTRIVITVGETHLSS